MRQLIIFFVVLQCCLLLAGCKKEVPFSEFEGSWKPISYSYTVGLKGLGPQNSYSLSPQMDTIIFTTYDHQGNIIAEHTYGLHFSITTILKDNSVLLIDEEYQALDSTGKVVRQFSNKNEVSLVDGQKDYGNSTKSQTVTPDRITTFSYDWSGMNTYVVYSELAKIQ